MRRLHPVLLAVAALSAATPSAQAFDLQQVPGTYAAPTYVTAPPDDTTRLLVVEQDGRIKLLKNDAGPATTYLDISGKVDSGGGEEGLLSMAFASVDRFYVFYTDGTGASSDLVVEAYDVALDRDSALSASADEVLRIDHPVGSNHNGGQLQVGPDGNLWISTGDGGGGPADFDGDAQDPNRLLGKILRITPGPDGDYTIPAGNPYAGGGGAAEVWALGLRNPWRFSFDSVTDDLLVGDVGEGTMEEVSHAPAPGRGAGANFGWPWYEGTHVLAAGTQPASHHAPIITQSADDGWHAITGGYVLRDPALAGDVGDYVYGDTYRSELCLYDFATRASYPTGEHVTTLVSFGEDAAGRVYAVSLNGDVHRLVAEDGPGEGQGETCGPIPPPAPATEGFPPPSDGTPPPQTTPPRAPPAVGLPIARAPRLVAGTAPRQRALRRRSVFVRAACDVACGLRASGRLAIGRARFGVRGARATAAPATGQVLRLRLGPRARRAARRALRRGDRVRALLTVTGVAESGASARRTLTVRVIR